MWLYNIGSGCLCGIGFSGLWFGIDVVWVLLNMVVWWRCGVSGFGI